MLDIIGHEEPLCVSVLSHQENEMDMTHRKNYNNLDRDKAMSGSAVSINLLYNELDCYSLNFLREILIL